MSSVDSDPVRFVAFCLPKTDTCHCFFEGGREVGEGKAGQIKFLKCSFLAAAKA